MAHAAGKGTRANARSRVKTNVFPQRVAPCDRVTLLAFWRVCRLDKRDQLAWLVGFRAGYYGQPDVWPLLGNLNPDAWTRAFVEGRGHQERGL
jgi:hypothetical protein